jgi:hypothetical protein
MGIANGPDLSVGKKKASKIFSLKAKLNEGFTGTANIRGKIFS